MAAIQPIRIRPSEIPESLADAIQLLPGFMPYTDGWEEQDLDAFPQVGAALIGEVDEIEISVAKLRNGSVQLTFAFDTESEEPDEEVVTCGVAWLFPSMIYPEGEDGRCRIQCGFRAQGYLHAILKHEQLLGIIRQTDTLLGQFLFGDPKQFMALTAGYSRIVDGELLPIEDEELDGNDFIRLFTFKVGTATYLSAEQ